jgi:hypothetical protein
MTLFFDVSVTTDISIYMESSHKTGHYFPVKNSHYFSHSMDLLGLNKNRPDVLITFLSPLLYVTRRLIHFIFFSLPRVRTQADVSDFGCKNYESLFDQKS